VATLAPELSAASDQAVKLPGVATDPLVTDWIIAVAAVVAAVGTGAAAIAAWLAARASATASREASDALVRQTEREAALEADATLRALEVDAQDSTVWPSRLGALHNRWQDGAAIPAMRLRDAETRRRVQLVGDVLFLAMQTATNEHTLYSFLAAIEDARAALDALLKNATPSPAGFPDRERLRELCPIRADGRTFEPLNDWLAQHFPGFRQLS